MACRRQTVRADRPHRRVRLPAGNPVPVESGRDYELVFRILPDIGTYGLMLDGVILVRSVPIETIVVVNSIYAGRS